MSSNLIHALACIGTSFLLKIDRHCLWAFVNVSSAFHGPFIVLSISSCAWHHFEHGWANVSRSPCFCSFDLVTSVAFARSWSVAFEKVWHSFLCWGNRLTHCPFDPFPPFPEGFPITAASDAFPTPRLQSLASLGPALWIALRQLQPPQPQWLLVQFV